MNDLRKIETNEIDKASQLLADCFFNDPLYIYFFPSPKARKRSAKMLFGYELRRSAGFTYVSDDVKAVAVYKSPNDEFINVPFFFCIKLFFAVGILTTFRAVKYLKFCENCKKKYKSDDEYYLSLLAVSKELQNRGVGSGIINNLNEKIYLETQNEKNAQIYIHLGFELVEKSNINEKLCHYVLKRKEIKNAHK